MTRASPKTDVLTMLLVHNKINKPIHSLGLYRSVQTVLLTRFVIGISALVTG